MICIMTFNYDFYDFYYDFYYTLLHDVKFVINLDGMYDTM